MIVRRFLLAAMCALPSGAQAIPSVDSIAQRLTFVSESTYTSYLMGLEAFGTRHPGQPNREAVAHWIAQRFSDAGISEVVLDSFSVSGLPQWNVIATIFGTEPSTGEIVIGAHYDSQSSIPTIAPGADDNASGTAAILEMARVLRASSYQPRRTLRFVAFGAEEFGLFGSDWYASRIDVDQRANVLMLNFDMIGHRRQDTTDRDVNVVFYDHAIEEAGRAVSTALMYTTLTPITTTQYRSGSDSWPFATRSIPCVFYIERDFSPQYHSTNDSSTYLDLTYATEISKAGLAMVLDSDTRSTSTVLPSPSPDGWELLQNYPNPFNPETRIGWRMKKRGYVQVSVWNSLGQHVATPVDGEREAGYHETEVGGFSSANRWPSGVYYYRVVVRTTKEHFSATKAMVLTR